MKLFRITAFLPWPFLTNGWLSVSTQCQEDKAWKPGILFIHQTPPSLYFFTLEFGASAGQYWSSTISSLSVLPSIYIQNTSPPSPWNSTRENVTPFSPPARAHGIGEHALMKPDNWPTSQVAMSDTADAKTVNSVWANTLLKNNSAWPSLYSGTVTFMKNTLPLNNMHLLIPQVFKHPPCSLIFSFLVFYKQG